MLTSPDCWLASVADTRSNKWTAIRIIQTSANPQYGLVMVIWISPELGRNYLVGVGKYSVVSNATESNSVATAQSSGSTDDIQLRPLRLAGAKTHLASSVSHCASFRYLPVND